MSVFPARFSDLEPFTEWALPRETERNRKRLDSSMPEMQRVYDAIIPRMDAIIAYLNDFELATLPEPERNLLNLTFSLADISFAIEVYERPTVANSFQEYGGAERFIAVHDGERFPGE